jgi:hypothetical protein
MTYIKFSITVSATLVPRRLDDMFRGPRGMLYSAGNARLSESHVVQLVATHVANFRIASICCEHPLCGHNGPGCPTLFRQGMIEQAYFGLEVGM